MTHPDMDELLNEGLEAGMRLLEKNGEFFPFGVTMSLDGEISLTQSFTEDKIPSSQELLDLLIEALSANAKSGEYKATALVSDVQLSQGHSEAIDAINVLIEHAEAEPISCSLPYSKHGSSIEYGKIIAEQGEHCVFGF